MAKNLQSVLIQSVHRSDHSVMIRRFLPSPFRHVKAIDSIISQHSFRTTSRPLTTTQRLLLSGHSGRSLRNRIQNRYSSTSNTQSLPQSSPSRFRSFATTSILAFLAFAVGFSMSAAAAVDTVNGMIKPPSDVETLTMYVPSTELAKKVEEHIKNHPLSRKLRATPGMKESRPHLKIPIGMRPHNLTGGVLLGEGMIEVPPLVFADNESELPSLFSISYLGKALCGHPGIIHGGMLATMLDEGLARACFPALPNKVGVTASLKVDYRVPCPAESYVVLKAYTTKVEGRKAWVKGWIELMDDTEDGSGTKLVEAEALFIEPKSAAGLAKIYSGQ